MTINQHRRAEVRAFSLIEAIVALGLFGIGFVSLYAGISSGMQLVQVARENLRATQIMVEKTETLRLYSWDQVASGTNIPPTFCANYYPTDLGSQGITYYGSVNVTNPDFSTAYSADMRQIIVMLRWTNFGIPRSREMRSYVARNGMQNYIF